MERAVLVIGLVFAVVLIPGPQPAPADAPYASWAVPVILGRSDSGVLGQPQVAFSPPGDDIVAIAVWEEFVTDELGQTTSSVWSATWQCLGGCHWDLPVAIRANISDYPWLRLAFGPTGDGIAVWKEADGVWASRFATATNEWGMAERVGAGGPVGRLDFAEDHQGNALAVSTWGANWSDSTISSIWFDGDTGWRTPELIAQHATDDTAVVMDSAGNAVVAWSDETEIFARSYDAAAQTWAPPVSVSGIVKPVKTGTIDEYSPSMRGIEMAPGGDATVVWGTRLVDTPRIWANRFVAATGSWGVPSLIAENTAWVDMAMDDGGNTTVVWSNRTDISARRFTADLGTWAESTSISGRMVQNWSEYLAPAGIEAAADGDAVVAWTHHWRPTCRDCWAWYRDVWVSRFNASRGNWGTSHLVAENATSSLMVLNAVGDAIVVWTEWPAGESIFARWLGAVSEEWSASVPIPGYSLTNYSSMLSVALDPYESSAVVFWQEWSANQTNNLIASWFYPGITLDLIPPVLRLKSPSDGIVTAQPTVTVVGITEPSAHVVVNGITAAVAENGSFSIPLPLSLGANTITATATDPAGNVASATVHVTHLDPLAALGMQTLLLEGLLAASLAVSGVSLALYWNLRRWSGYGGIKNESSHPDPPAGRPAGSLVRARRAVKSGPRNGTPIELTVKERILLHLNDYAKRAEDPEAPAALTQESIAQSCWFDQRHFAQYVRPLVRAGVIWEGLAHVEGLRNRRKVYRLTDAGRRQATRLQDKLRETLVSVQDRGKVREATIADILAGVHGASILGLVRESMGTGIVDLGANGNQSRRP